ncbi:MAG: hypothetical protein Q9228_007677, partial [Teloschistes exilis]
MAFYLKGIVEERIQQVLTQVSGSEVSKRITVSRGIKLRRPDAGFDLAQNLDHEDTDNEGSPESSHAIATTFHPSNGGNQQICRAAVKNGTLPQPKDGIDPGVIV